MLIIPAIDLRKGRVVRLTKGAADEETAYSDSPVEVFQKWQDEGAKLVHVVDLDGAMEGTPANLNAVRDILKIARIPIQFGGGLRSIESVRSILEAGVARAVIGTKALDQDFVKKLAEQFRERVAVGIDLRNGVIQTHGWTSGEPGQAIEPFLRLLEKEGIKTVIVTDVNRDGTLAGPNLALLGQVLSKTRMDVIHSGGISELAHVEGLARITSKNFKGVIVGKALYEKKFTLLDAIGKFQKE